MLQVEGAHLLTLAAARFPQVDWRMKRTDSGLGQAPAEARALVLRVRGT